MMKIVSHPALDAIQAAFLETLAEGGYVHAEDANGQVDANWWIPAWLDRLLPTIDIEGEQSLPAPEYVEAEVTTTAKEGELVAL